MDTNGDKVTRLKSWFPTTSGRAATAHYQITYYKIPILAATKYHRMKHDDDFEANLAGEDGQSEESKTSWFKRIKKGIL